MTALDRTALRLRRWATKSPRVALGALFALLAALRFPTMLHAPTLYAEEGIVYFRYALSHGVWDALTARQVGYYALFPNLTGVLCALVPLSYAPYVAILLGLVAPSLCAYLVIEADVALRDKALSLGLIVFTVTMRMEWGSSIHAQFWLACALVLMLASAPEGKRGYAMHTLIVALGATTGVVGSLVAPFYLVAWLRLRERRLLAVGVVLALALVLHVQAGASRAPSWALGELLAVLLVKLAIVPFVGKLADPLGHAAFVHAREPLGFASVLLGFGAWVVFVVTQARGRFRWLAIAALSVGAACHVFALPPYEALARAMGGSRYALVGVVPVCIALVCSRSRQSLVVRRLTAVLAAAALAAGLASGVKLADDRVRSPSTYGDDVARFAHDPGVTLTLHQARCRLSTNDVAQREGFAVHGPLAPDAAERTLVITPGRYDRDVAVGVFVVAGTRDAPAFVLTREGFERHTLMYYGESKPFDAGGCYGSAEADPVAPYTTFRGDAYVLRLPVAHLRALPGDATTVYVGYGRDFADALAKGTFRELTRSALEGAPSR